MAPPGGAIYANLMRSVAVDTQQRLSGVLDTGLVDAGHVCEAASRTDTGTPVTPACRGMVWAQASWSSLSLGGSPGLDTDRYDLLVGTDAQLGDAFHLGAEAGAGRIRGQHDASGQGNRVRNVHAGIYAFADVGAVVLSATLDEMHSDYRVQRETGIGPAGASPDGRTLSAGLQAAWPMALGNGSLTPKVGVLYQHQRLDGFKEYVASSISLASAFGVEGSHTTATSVQPYAAVAYTATLQSGSVTYVPEVEAGYFYQARDDDPAVQLTAQDGTVFMLPGTGVGRSMGTIHAGISAMFGGSWSVNVNYRGLFANHLHDNMLTVGLSKRL